MFGIGNKQRRMTRKYYLIIGCGRLGATLANMLSLKGKEVIVIDEDKASFRKLPAEYSGFSIEADGTDIDVLESAHIMRAEYIFAVTDNDNANITIAHIAKKIYDVPNTVARIYDTDKEVIMQDEDITTIYPTKLSLSEMKKLLLWEGKE